MLPRHTIAATAIATIVLASLVNALTYPNPTRGTVHDNYFGTTVHDPYRWMEDPNAEATKSFVAAQNALSKSYFEQCPFREQMKERYSALMNYRKSSPPQKRGKYYFQYAIDGLQDQESPAMLYGYGGYGVNVLPEFSSRRVVFMQSYDGVVAIANIRGGGEFGTAWHAAGRLLNKQNGFDDFQAAAEYLIHENYTSASKMIIEGASNGGRLVSVCVNQRPELYGAAIAFMGIGHDWVSDLGSSEDRVHFPNIYSYSPLHNIRFPNTSGTQYPAVLVITGDHDDRVVPSHSYKYIAELQNQIGSNENQTHPLLLRVETDVGHGGLPLFKLIDAHVDIMSFLIQSLDLSFDGQKAHGSSGGVCYSIIIIWIAFVISLLRATLCAQ